MRVHIAYSMPHYGHHLWPIATHLPDEIRGERFHLVKTPISPGDPDDVVMVASGGDVELIRDRRVIYVEHGAGQTYLGGKHPRSYAGYRHPAHVVGFISPRQEIADLWGRPAFATGSPICDPFELLTDNSYPAVAITFHWASLHCPETRSALDHYATILEPLVHRLAREGFAVLGHHHPRDRRLPRMWRNLGVEVVDAATVRRSADLLIADNTSLMFEMGYLMREVVALNAPWFRRDVNHGLRFWDAPFLQVDEPADLLALDFNGLLRDGTNAQTAASYAYGAPYSDGNDGLRAAAWVTQFVAGL